MMLVREVSITAVIISKVKNVQMLLTYVQPLRSINIQVKWTMQYSYVATHL